MALTPKREAFVREYLVDLNAAAAAERAGYSVRGAKQEGNRLREDPEVAAAIEAAIAAQAARLEITADRVIAELARVGFASLSDVSEWGEREVAIGYDADGKRLSPADIGEAAVIHREMAPFLSLTDSDALAPEHRAAVAEVALTKDGFKIKMHDKVGALALLGRRFKLFTDNVNVRTPEGLTINVRRFTPEPDAD